MFEYQEKVRSNFRLREGQLSELQEAIKKDFPVWGPNVGVFKSEWFLIYELHTDVSDGCETANIVLLPMDRDSLESFLAEQVYTPKESEA